MVFFHLATAPGPAALTRRAAHGNAGVAAVAVHGPLVLRGGRPPDRRRRVRDGRDQHGVDDGALGAAARLLPGGVDLLAEVGGDGVGWRHFG